MPGMNGARATRQIMDQVPVAVLIVTASIKQNSSLVFEAIGAGALDVVRTPVLSGANQTEATQMLLDKIGRIEKLLTTSDNGAAVPPAPATNGQGGSSKPAKVAARVQ